MKGRFILLGVALSISLLSGCATAPKSARTPATAGTLASNQGRIRVYWLACRTLAVLGDKTTIAPMLQDPDEAVKADAFDAIFQLQGKAPDSRDVKKAI